MKESTRVVSKENVQFTKTIWHVENTVLNHRVILVSFSIPLFRSIDQTLYRQWYSKDQVDTVVNTRFWSSLLTLGNLNSHEKNVTSVFSSSRINFSSMRYSVVYVPVHEWKCSLFFIHHSCLKTTFIPVKLHVDLNLWLTFYASWPSVTGPSCVCVIDRRISSLNIVVEKELFCQNIYIKFQETCQVIWIGKLLGRKCYMKSSHSILITMFLIHFWKICVKMVSN